MVATSALKGEGLTEVVDRAVRLANAKTIQVPKHEFSREVEGCLADIADLLPNSVPDHLARWYSIKLFEQDEKVLGTTPAFCRFLEAHCGNREGCREADG